jgi:hypothetical protein
VRRLPSGEKIESAQAAKPNEVNHEKRNLAHLPLPCHRVPGDCASE